MSQHLLYFSLQMSSFNDPCKNGAIREKGTFRGKLAIFHSFLDEPTKVIDNCEWFDKLIEI